MLQFQIYPKSWWKLLPWCNCYPPNEFGQSEYWFGFSLFQFRLVR